MKAEINEYLDQSIAAVDLSKRDATPKLLSLSQAKVLEKRAKLQSQELSKRSHAYRMAANESKDNKLMNIVNYFQPVEMYKN